MDKTSLFGVGFILGRYADTYKNEVQIMERNSTSSLTRSVLFARSTTHNYHPKDGDPFVDIDTNLTHFIRVLDNSYKLFKNNLVFNLVSTWFVLGASSIPATEDSPCNPTGFYSATALCREQLLKSFCMTFGVKYRILRLANVIGIGDKKISRRKNALQHMIRELAQGRDVDYLYNGGAIRDYIDVRDCVKAIRLVLERGELNQTYHISNCQGLNVNDLVYVAWEASGFKSKISTIPVPDFHRVVQAPKMVLDNSKIRKLGYVQTYDIKQSVRELVHHYQNESPNDS